MDNRYKLSKTKCSICKKTVKKIINKNKEFNDYDFYKTIRGDYVCKQCEQRYHLLDGYSCRGYGYKHSTEPKFTSMDTGATPTFGVELEVAGNIKHIDKISKLCDPKWECSIGYDTSVEGAMFELSYCPGTYYWYLYESKLRAVCALLQKDPWTIKDSITIGTHIHVGNIRSQATYNRIRVEAQFSNRNFWDLMRIVGGRDFNRYCSPYFRGDHHDAISLAGRWDTVEFRFFSGTYDFKTILNRMKFLRQLIDNATDDGVNWKNFNPKVKAWIKELIEKSDSKRKDELLEYLEQEKSNINNDELRKQILRGNCLDEYNYDEEEESEDEDWDW